jgi:hypothetical protein
MRLPCTDREGQIHPVERSMAAAHGSTSPMGAPDGAL